MSEPRRLTLLKLGPDAGPEAALAAAAAYDELEAAFAGSVRSSARSGRGRLVVVGGGIVGLMSAYFASVRGYRVRLVERLSPGGAASGRNGGGVLVLGHTLDDVPFNRLSLRLWAELARAGVASELTVSGHVMLAFSEQEAETLRGAGELYLAAGLPVEWLDSSEVRRLLPHVTAEQRGGLRCPVDAQAYPFRVVSSLLSRLRDGRAELITHTRVTGFRVEGSRVRAVITEAGDVEADAVLLCAGPWSAEVGAMLGLPLAISPRRSQILVTERVATRVVHPFVTGNSIYLRQTHAGNLMYGGGGTWESQSFDTSSTTTAIARLTTRFLEVFPAFRGVQLIRAFAGTVDLTPDARPLLGRADGWENVCVAAGFSGHGFGWSAAAGAIAAACVARALGHEEPAAGVSRLLEPLAPCRHAPAARPQVRGG